MSSTEKIALSASHYNVPEVHKVLMDCDVIYTTNMAAMKDLYYRYRNVRGMPDSTEATIEWIKSRHPGAEFVTFSDLHRIAACSDYRKP